MELEDADSLLKLLETPKPKDVISIEIDDFDVGPTIGSPEKSQKPLEFHIDEMSKVDEYFLRIKGKINIEELRKRTKVKFVYIRGQPKKIEGEKWPALVPVSYDFVIECTKAQDIDMAIYADKKPKEKLIEIIFA